MPWDEKFVLTISWWGSKWMYACWILKAMEEKWIKERIEAIYGVSAWALTWAYWLSWWKAEAIFNKYMESWLFSIKNISLFPMKGLMKEWTMEKIIKWEMRRRFEQLELPLYVWCTDLLKWKFMVYNSWELMKPVLWSLALPWIFAPIEYDWALLVDWGVTNNFPIDVARKKFPKAKHIWILLSKFKKNQKITNLLDTLQVTYDLLLKWHLSQSYDKADILFYRDLKTWTVENNEKKLRHLFELWYQDGLDAFSY